MAKYQPGDYVKVEFQEERSGQSEWMWLKIDRADDGQRLIFGRLDNDPVVSSDLHVGMELAVSYDQVCEHMKASAFNQ